MSGRDRAEATGLRVLVVDDDGDFLEGLQTLLEIDGHTVRACASASSTIAAAPEFMPQVTLLDLSLPDADGFTVARRLRKEDPHREMLLVAMSGFGGPDIVQRAHEAGFDHHLLKPISFDSIRELMRRTR